MSSSTRLLIPLLLALAFLHTILTLSESASLGFLQPLRVAGKADLAAVSRLTTDDFLGADAECTRGGNFHYPKCSPGYWCLGNSPPRCKKRSELGGPCGTEYQECGDLMDCVGGKCAMRTFRRSLYLDLGAVCEKDSFKKCLPGLWCVEKKCRRLNSCGSLCNPPAEICREGLRCSTLLHTSLMICTRIVNIPANSSVLHDGQSCARGKSPPCRRGLKCVDNAGEGSTCQKTLRIGEICKVSEQCEFGRVCRDVAGDMKCIHEQEVGQVCDEANLLICDSKSECVGNKCVPLSPAAAV